MESAKTSRLSHAGIILACGMACAFVAMFVSLVVGQAMLPPSDGAYGLNAFELLCDPFVVMLAFPTTLIDGAIGSVFAVVLLRRTDLRRSIPIVAGVTIVATAAFSAMMPELNAAPIGLAFGLWAMMACRTLCPLKEAQVG